MNAAHLTQATKICCGWIKTWIDKAVKTTGSRTSLNILGAINLNDIGSAHVERVEKVNSETIQQFLAQLRDNEGSNKTIHLVLDGAAYHRANAVKKQSWSSKVEVVDSAGRKYFSKPCLETIKFEPPRF